MAVKARFLNPVIALVLIAYRREDQFMPQPADLTLHYFPMACSLVPLILLNEVGAEFSVEVVDLFKGANMSPEFLKLNPKHRVPVLVVNGEPLTENLAIQLWIAAQFPDAKFLPEEGLDRYRAISLLAWCASGIHPTLTPNARPERYCDLPDSADSVRRCAQEAMHKNFAIAEEMLAGREWFFDHFTCADAYFFWTFRRGSQFGTDLSIYPACQAHHKRMAARPSVAKALAFEEETMNMLKGKKDG
jgi:glutathione S-transferase